MFDWYVIDIQNKRRSQQEGLWYSKLQDSFGAQVQTDALWLGLDTAWTEFRLAERAIASSKMLLDF